MKTFLWTLVVFSILAILIGGLLLLYINKMVKEPVVIDHILCEIRYGDTAKTIAKNLHEKGVVKDELLFYLLIRHKGLDKTLKAGYYLFSGNLNMFDTLEKIVSGEILVERVTIPEGYSLFRTLKTISKSGIGDYDKLLKIATTPQFAQDVTGFEVENIEGFLYPDTYILGYDMDEENILRAIVKNFFVRLESGHIKITDKEQFYHDLTLASIVEKEVMHSDEKPIIAGVFLNRLDKKLKLQACPTVTYYLEPDFLYKSVLTYSDTRNPSPHNTYVIPGLPPSPICSPPVSTIFAVQNFEKTPYLFFFADKKGRHIFSRTYAEHLRKQNDLKVGNILPEF